MELNLYLSTTTCPQASFYPWLEGYCAPAICPLSLALNRCRGREGGRPAVVSLLLALALCQSRKGGAMKQCTPTPH